MKKIYFVLIPVVVLLFFGFLNRDIVSAKVNDVLYQSPCDTPKYYSIGRVDSEFQLSRPAFAEAMSEAATIWEVAYGKEVFVYDPKAPFTVDLIYDSRQSLNTEINQMSDALTTEDSALKPEIAEHNRKSKDLERRIAALNEEIQSWNERGGAPADVYERLISEQAALNKQVDALNAEGVSLQVSTKNLNDRIDQLNNTVDTFNEALQYKPEGGKYILDAAGERIEISIFDSHQELVSVLAHEMGHALGMNHVLNPESIMFAKSSGAVTPSQDDLKELALACHKQNVIGMKFTEASISLQHLVNKLLTKASQAN